MSEQTETNLEYAIERLKQALKYGPDMHTSSLLCVADALSLVETASKGNTRMFVSEKGGAK